MGQWQPVAGSFQGNAVAQILDLLEAENSGLAESFVPFVSGFRILAGTARDAVRDDPACVGAAGFKAAVSQVAFRVPMNLDPEVDPSTILFRQEALEVAGHAGIAFLHAQLDALPD